MLIKNVIALAFISTQVIAQTPDWYPRLELEDTTGLLKQCTKKQTVGSFPATGMRCSKFPKICFFGSQDCPGVGSHPTLECECDGGFAEGATRTWTCTDEPCPTGDPITTTVAPVVTTVAPDVTTVAPDVTTVAPDSMTTVAAATTADPDLPTTSAPPCPVLVPDTGDSCPINGRTCTYTGTASNITTECVDTNACTCGSNTWTCAPTVTECTELPPPECPPEVPGAADTCNREGTTCTYSETSSNDTDVCVTDTACTCDGTGFGCAAPETTCTDRPPRVCPPSAPTGDAMSCPEAGFSCTYTTGSSNSSSICNTTEVCTCGDDLFYGCAAPTTTCIDGPTFSCPPTPGPGAACDAPGLECDYTRVDQNATTRCDLMELCTCGIDGTVSCADPVATCVDQALEACPPSQPDEGDACATTGLQCGFISQTSNATNVCNTTTTCTCDGAGYGCAEPTIECIGREVGTCSDVKPSTGDTCGADVACIYTGTITNSTASCDTEETCTCTGGIITCDAPMVACSPIATPVCAAEPTDGGSCSPNGLQCTYNIPEANQTDVCTRTEVCTCAGGVYGCEVTGTECVPALEKCPLSRPDTGAACGLDTLECTYMGTLRNDTSTCAITTTCSCDGTAYACAQTNVQCEDSAPLTCPESAPLGSPACDVVNLNCEYVTPTGDGCIDKTTCSCGGGPLVFTCGATTNECPP